jgi:D-alanyl-D-alanine carboxypeptidase/D-alanyl-D-alanine-endopeptidase (penicillin-binding protein 4)
MRENRPKAQPPARRRIAPKTSLAAVTAAAWFCCAVLFAQTLPLKPQTARPVDPLTDLQRRIAAIINQPRYREAFWGIAVISLDTHRVLFQQNAGRLFSPASNSKLFTTALALDRLGPDYQIRTSLYARERPNSRGTLKGDLLLYGRGDPTINARMYGGNLLAALEPLVAAVSKAGIKKITGDLVADESYFHGPPFGSDWSWNDLQYSYGAEVSALTINDNAVSVVVRPGEREGAPALAGFDVPAPFLAITNLARTVAADAKAGLTLYRPVGENLVYITGMVPLNDPGSADTVTVHHPALLFGWLLKDALARHGIIVSGRVRTVDWLDRESQPVDLKQLVEVASVNSPPLRAIVHEVNKTSNNLYADLLLNTVGMVTQGTGLIGPDDTSEGLGLKALRAFLTEAGVPQDEVLFTDGSGLSNDNLVTPNAVVKLLDYMSRERYWGDYVDSLPQAGVDGTLRVRMRNTPAAGMVRAKTGTSTWTDALSGYVSAAGGERFAFSLMLNRYHDTDPKHSRTADLDEIAELLAQFNGKAAAQ